MSRARDPCSALLPPQREVFLILCMPTVPRHLPRIEGNQATHSNFLKSGSLDIFNIEKFMKLHRSIGQ